MSQEIVARKYSRGGNIVAATIFPRKYYVVAAINRPILSFLEILSNQLLDVASAARYIYHISLQCSASAVESTVS